MIAEVWHATERLFHEDATGHVQVAIVELPDDMDNMNAIEEAYHLTNHIHIPWWDNAEVTRTTQKDCRSTSTGDIVRIGTKSWRVLGIGWEEIIEQKENENAS